MAAAAKYNILPLDDRFAERCGTETMDVGMDCVSPVCNEYEKKGLFPFTGTIESVTFEFGDVKEPPAWNVSRWRRRWTERRRPKTSAEVRSRARTVTWRSKNKCLMNDAGTLWRASHML